MNIKITSFFKNYDNECNSFTVLAFTYFKNGSWNTWREYTKPRRRLCYVYTGVILFNKELEILIEF